MMQPIDHLLLRGDLGLGLGNLRIEPTGIESGQHLPALDVIAFLRQYRGDALTAIEWQLDLSQIDISIQQQFGALAVTAKQPPQQQSCDDDDDDDADGQCN
jgi:hypothetical protein